MKIRIKGNTVRYRLAKSEVAALVENKYLEEETPFMSQTLVYAIQQTGGDALTADFVQNKITLYVPAALLQQWAATNQVGITHNTPLGNNTVLCLLLEKDFKCIDGDMTEDQSDYFENPHLTC